jgi:LPXTG-motif cell wall-anchored protein
VDKPTTRVFRHPAADRVEVEETVYGSKVTGTGTTATGAVLATTGSNSILLLVAGLALVITGALLWRSSYLSKKAMASSDHQDH